MNHAASAPASLFGKLPSVLDYVRINHSYGEAIALDEWLQRCLQDLTLAGLSWSMRRTRFLFVPAGASAALLGVLQASRDRAGRKFPLTIFRPLPCSTLRAHLASLPMACAAFLSQAEALLDRTKELSREDLADALEGLPQPTPDLFASADEQLRAELASREAGAFEATLFGDDASTRAPRAYALLLSVLTRAPGGSAERACVLDCPVRTEQDFASWLSLAMPAVRARQQLPSLFWSCSDSAVERLLISVAPPAGTLAVWLADPQRRSDRLLTLTSSRLPMDADQLLERLSLASSELPSESVAQRFARWSAAALAAAK